METTMMPERPNRFNTFGRATARAAGLTAIGLATACLAQAPPLKEAREDSLTESTNDAEQVPRFRGQGRVLPEAAPRSKVSVAWNAIDAQARFLAGMTGGPTGIYAELERLPSWRAHALAMDRAWVAFEKDRLVPMRAWEEVELANAIDSTRPLIYFFGGPDAITADVLYPDAPVLVLGGLERAGVLSSDLRTLSPQKIEAALSSVRFSIGSILRDSFFITSRMSVDLLRSPLRGVIPVLLVMLARNGEHIVAASPLTFGPAGEENTVAALPGAPTTAGGWKIILQRNQDQLRRELYYVRLDLSNEVAQGSSGYFAFLSQLAPANCLLKAASYILSDNHFDYPRDFLLKTCTTILQDDSGIPYRLFPSNLWHFAYFGRLSAPTGPFANRLQADMAEAWSQNISRPLPFRIGYRHSGKESFLLLAHRR